MVLISNYWKMRRKCMRLHRIWKSDTDPEKRKKSKIRKHLDYTPCDTVVYFRNSNNFPNLFKNFIGIIIFISDIKPKTYSFESCFLVTHFTFSSSDEAI